ncbi:MAG TPA: SHOCT domain-containing protein [Solirubrobacterales bacterium]
MVGGTGHVVSTPGAATGPVEDAASEANRIDALTKLKDLYVTGVLTEEQYASEHARLTEGI